MVYDSNVTSIFASPLFETTFGIAMTIVPIIVIGIAVLSVINIFGRKGFGRMRFRAVKIIGTIIPLGITLIIGFMVFSQVQDAMLPPSSDVNPQPYTPHPQQPSFEEENKQPLNLNTSPTYNYTPTNINYEELDYDYEMDKLYEGYDNNVIQVDDSLDMDLESI